MLKKETMAFLKALKVNNNRDWFAENKSRYDDARSDFEALVSRLIAGISAFDPEISYTDPKKAIFRIYRDTRFSPDKTPYKTHFGAVFRPQGMDKSSGYYIHADPEESFLTCGHYMLRPDQLKKVRKGIYDDYTTFRSILEEKQFKKEIGDLYFGDEMLKRVPNGFEKDHPAAEYLKLKHIYALKNVPEQKFFDPDFVEYAVNIYKIMLPLNTFLNELLEE
jgi:TIGR02453 family protein